MASEITGNLDNGTEAALSDQQPMVTFINSIEGVIAEGQQMTLSEANELVKNLGPDKGSASKPVQVKIDFVLDGKPDYYCFSLKIGTGRSLLGQMKRQEEDFYVTLAKVEHLLNPIGSVVNAEFETGVQTILREIERYRFTRMAAFFECHCKISETEQAMIKYADKLPEAEKRHFTEFVQTTITGLRRKANHMRPNKPIVQVQETAQERPVETQTPGRPPEQRRKSIKQRLQQHRKEADRHSAGRQPKQNRKRSRPTEPGR